MASAYRVATIALAGVAIFVACAPGWAADPSVRTPAPTLTALAVGHRETAIFAGGCFWGVQGVFAHVKGVSATVSGYTGGTASTATYPIVSTGTTGHAESVRVVFDPAQVSYADLLQIYFSVATDPTVLDAQGPDEGPQYRSALFPTSPAQAKVARAYIAQLTRAHVYAAPIVTQIEAGRGFFAAEGYHQNFMARNPDYPYIVVNDRPKVEALKRMFPQRYRA